MKLSDLEDRLVPLYLASVAPGGAALKLCSRPGRGKTSVLALIAGMLNKHFPGKRYGSVVLNGACMTLTTATGYLKPEARDGVQYSEFTRPSWWTTSEGLPLEAYDGGVIVIDEADKLGLDEKKITGEAALSKVFGNHRLPPGWVVWFAGNYSTDRSGSTRELDHLILRQITIHVTDDVASLLTWMERNHCLPETKLFAEEKPELVFQDMPEKQEPYGTPRTVAQADLYLRTVMRHLNTDKIPTDALTLEIVKGGIGGSAAAGLFATIRLGQELPPYADIVAKPTTSHLPAKPDVRRLACWKMAAQVSASDMEPVLTYVKRLPDEFQMMFGKSVALRAPMLTLNKHYAAWAAGKSQLIELMMKLK